MMKSKVGSQVNGLVVADRIGRIRLRTLRGMKWSWVILVLCQAMPIPAEDTVAQIRQLGGRTEFAIVTVDLTSCGQARDAEDFRRLVPLLKRLPHLRELRLSFLVSNGVLAELHPLSQLERLDLTAAQITDEGIQHLFPFQRLRSLSLVRTRVTDQGMPEIARLTSLRDLDLSITAVSDEGLQFLTALPHLKRLDASYLKEVTDKGMDSIAQMKSVETVWVYGTKLTDRGLQSLKNLPKLRELRVELTAVTESGVRTFSTDLPAALVRSDFGDFQGGLLRSQDGG